MLKNCDAVIFHITWVFITFWKKLSTYYFWGIFPDIGELTVNNKDTKNNKKVTAIGVNNRRNKMNFVGTTIYMWFCFNFCNNRCQLDRNRYICLCYGT